MTGVPRHVSPGHSLVPGRANRHTGLRHTHAAIGDAFDERRQELARAALAIWSEEGYAQVSVRNVARRTRLGHGLVHYYFKDKSALVAACLRMAADDLVIGCDFGAAADNVQALSTAVADAVVDTFRRESRVHRIRYDLRYHALFVPTLRAHAAAFDALIDDWIDVLRGHYEALGSQSGRRFDLMALQLDACLAHAVRAEFLGEDIDYLARTLYDDCLLILPTDAGRSHATRQHGCSDAHEGAPRHRSPGSGDQI